MAWDQVQKSHSPEQVALLRRFSKSGRKAFYVVKSAEAARAGSVKAKPSRFKPARSK